MSANRPSGGSLSGLYDETGLASRSLFRDRTVHALSRAARCDGRIALVLLEVGDPDSDVEASSERRRVAKEMLRRVRPEDTIAWLDDRYIGVLVESVEGGGVAQRVRHRLEESLPGCHASSVAVSDSRGRIGYWLGGSKTD